MSRAHMLYNDTAINKVLNLKWQERWQEDAVFRFKDGLGAIIEGNVEEKFKVAITDPTSGITSSHHYSVLNLEFTRAYKRSFDSSGVEIEPWKSSTKKVNTGYLSYKTVDVETCNITLEDLLPLINIPALNDAMPKIGVNTVRVFCNESSLPNLEIDVGENVRLKTKGNGPYVEYIQRIGEGHVIASEHAGGSQASWTDKIMSMKGEDDKASDQPDGVDESEWDD